MSPQAWANLQEMYPETAKKCLAGERTAMPDRIRAALEGGEGVPGCRLLERGEHVRVDK